jgi:hypothetical protein
MIHPKSEEEEVLHRSRAKLPIVDHSYYLRMNHPLQS